MTQEKVTLYIIRGISTGKNYVGITNTVERRLAGHRSGRTKGGQIIGTFELIHTEEFDDYLSAREREVFLKSGKGRNWIKSNLVTRRARAGIESV